MRWLLLALWLAATSAVAQTVTAGSINTPSGYSIDLTTGNLIQYDSSLKTNNGWTTTGMTGSFTTDGYTFSYASGTVSQTVNLGSFPLTYQNSGAVYVTGISYGFKYRFPCANSIGGSCDNTSGPQDTLNATFEYYKQDGTVEHSQYYSLGLKNINDGYSAYNPNWQQLADTYTFTGAKTLATAGSAKLSITGMDAGFWACLGSDCYGPQVKDAYLNVNYSVDPCILNPAYSPSCSGFSAVIQYGQSPIFAGNYYIPTKLPHIGGGVQLHGYEYGFGFYAGDYCTNTFMFWCTSSSGANARNVSVNITNGAGTSLIYDNWYVAGDYSGGSRYGRALFTESQNSLTMGYVAWNVWGGYGDNMGIYTWTRPIWTPDPCYTQPLYSPNCSNFDAEIKRLADEQNTIQKASLDKTVASVSSTTDTPTSIITTTINDPNSTAPKVATSTTPLEPPLDKPPPPPGTPPPSDKPPSPGALPPPPGSPPPPGIGPATIQSTPASTPAITIKQENATSLALSIVSKNQERETNIATQASQNAIQDAAAKAITSVRESISVALESAANSSKSSLEVTQTQAQVSTGPETRASQQLQIVSAPVSTSVVSILQRPQQQTQQEEKREEQQNTSTVNIQVVNIAPSTSTSVSQSSIVNLTQPPQQFVETKQEQVTTTYIPPIQPNTTLRQEESFKQQEQQVTTFTQQAITPTILAPVQQQQEQTVSLQVTLPNVAVIETPRVDIQQVLPQSATASVTAVTSVELPQPTNNFLTNKADPINSIVEQKQDLNQEQTLSSKTQTVKQNVQDNDLATGVSINTIAVIPTGFNAYTTALKDVAFYEPKEIYRNQRVVDNQRALRQLGTDRLHQEMIELQYRSR